MSSSSVKTVDRLVQVLDCFSTEKPVWSLADLSAHLRLPKSTLHRFLVSLEVHGILRRDPEDKLWRLGYRLFIWGGLAEESTGLGHLAKLVMQELAIETGEMVALTIYQDQEVVCIAKVDTHHSVRLALTVGARRPPYAGASSKILMAFLPEAEIEAIIAKGLPKLYVNSITDPDVLRADLAVIRSQGYALSIEETDPGAWGIAMPIRGRHGRVVAAIGVAGPTLRFSDEISRRCVDACRRASARIFTLLQKGTLE